MQLKQYSCSKCGSTNLRIEIKSTSYLGLYCLDCGSWIRKINKAEMPIAYDKADHAEVIVSAQDHLLPKQFIEFEHEEGLRALGQILEINGVEPLKTFKEFKVKE